VRIDSGLDDGQGAGTADNGALEADEIDQTSYVCNGENGTDGADGAGGIHLYDATGADMGTVISASEWGGITVITPTGYMTTYGWDGKLYGNQYYFTASSTCDAGTMYLNSGSDDPTPMYGKTVSYHPRTGQILVPADVNADGFAISVGNLSVVAIDNYGSCYATSSGHGWKVAPISAAAAGVKAVLPLPFSMR
jgi:hypothetical protein